MGGGHTEKATTGEKYGAPNLCQMMPLVLNDGEGRLCSQGSKSSRLVSSGANATLFELGGTLAGTSVSACALTESARSGKVDRAPTPSSSTQNTHKHPNCINSASTRLTKSLRWPRPYPSSSRSLFAVSHTYIISADPTAELTYSYTHRFALPHIHASPLLNHSGPGLTYSARHLPWF